MLITSRKAPCSCPLEGQYPSWWVFENIKGKTKGSHFTSWCACVDHEHIHHLWCVCMVWEGQHLRGFSSHEHIVAYVCSPIPLCIVAHICHSSYFAHVQLAILPFVSLYVCVRSTEKRICLASLLPGNKPLLCVFLATSIESVCVSLLPARKCLCISRMASPN